MKTRRLLGALLALALLFGTVPLKVVAAAEGDGAPPDLGAPAAEGLAPGAEGEEAAPDGGPADGQPGEPADGADQPADVEPAGGAADAGVAPASGPEEGPAPLRAPSGVAIDEASFPDDAFRAFVEEDGYDSDGDGALSPGEVAAATVMDCSGRGIADLAGIGHFTALESLDCSSNQLASLDVGNNPALTELWCNSNRLSSLDVGANAELVKLWCYNNQLSSLDVGANAALEWLVCGDNQLSSLDVGANAALQTLYCSNNQLSSLDVGANAALERLDCRGNQLSSLDVGANAALWELDCSSNQLSSLDVGANAELISLCCSSNQLASLDVSNNAALWELLCGDNQLASLDVGANAHLGYLVCRGNQLSSLDVSAVPILLEAVANGKHDTYSGEDYDVYGFPGGKWYLCVDKDVEIVTEALPGPLSFTVSFDANGGDASSVPASQDKVAGEDLALPASTPARPDTTAPGRTVSYDANGGSGAPSAQTATVTISYSFTGWNAAQDGTGDSYEAGGTYSADADATLYAQWSTTPAAQTLVVAGTPMRDGHTFKDWNTSADGSGTPYAVGDPLDPAEDLTLYAQWEEDATAPAEDTYAVSSGDNGTWMQDSGEDYELTVDRVGDNDACFEHFRAVELDGRLLSEDEYEARSGSTIITLKAHVLERLAPGRHAVTVVFDDGSVDVGFTVREAASGDAAPGTPDAPGTGAAGSAAGAAGSAPATAGGPARAPGAGRPQTLPRTGDGGLTRLSLGLALASVAAACAGLGARHVASRGRP